MKQENYCFRQRLLKKQEEYCFEVVIAYEAGKLLFRQWLFT